VEQAFRPFNLSRIVNREGGEGIYAFQPLEHFSAERVEQAFRPFSPSSIFQPRGWSRPLGLRQVAVESRLQPLR
jgi:hypothetical protein